MKDIKTYETFDNLDLTSCFSIDQWPELYRDRLDKVSFTDKIRYADRLFEEVPPLGVTPIHSEEE